MRASIVTAYYKNEVLTQKFLSNLVGKIGEDDEVIVVNAGSTEIDMTHYPYNVVRIDLEQNVSFSNSMNAGLKEVTGDYVIVIGNDTFPMSSDWIDKLIETQKQTGAWITCPDNSNPGHKAYERHLIKDDGHIAEYRMFPAICWLMPDWVLVKIGFFDERFKIGTYEDDDYVMRVRQAGGSVILNKDVMVHHRLSSTMQLFDVPTIMQINEKVFREKWKL